MSDFISNIGKYLPLFFTAFTVTITLALISLVLATVVGILVGLINTTKSKNIFMKLLRGLANIYIEIIRGTPMLVQILFFCFGVPAALRPITGFTWASVGGMFTAGIVVLTLNAGAYMAEIVRAGIESVDSGQVEAARSLGLPYGKTMTKVILPQAIRTMLPSIINQFIITIKDTSLLSAVGVAELTNNAKTISSMWSSQTLLLYAFTGLFYFVICFTLSRVARLLEKRMSYGR